VFAAIPPVVVRWTMASQTGAVEEVEVAMAAKVWAFADSAEIAAATKAAVAQATPPRSCRRHTIR